MTRSLVVLLALTLPGPLLATTGARGEAFANPKAVEDSFQVTRSDGTVGRMKPPDQTEVKKIVGYIRDGMNHADRSDREKQARGKYKYIIRIKRRI